MDPTTGPPKMSILALSTPLPHPSFSRQRTTGSDGVALPSIRQAFPELHHQLQLRDSATKPTLRHTSEVAPALGISAPGSPNANKRRRLSVEDEGKERTRQVRRLYYRPERAPSKQISSGISTRSAARENWAVSARTSPFLHSGAPPGPSPIQTKDRADTRPALPRLPPPGALETEPTVLHRIPALVDSYTDSQPLMPQSRAPTAESAPLAYQETSYGCAGSIHPFNRTPSRDSGYGAFYQGFVRFWHPDLAGLGGDNKQRKRRGNLPKETTDKLRAWFVAHLQHPYPTEGEKQELMRQTGIQMNQISNWFINARRRQLPTTINKRAPHIDAMAGARSGVIKTLEGGRREPAGPPSDDDGAAYDNDLKDLLAAPGCQDKRGQAQTPLSTETNGDNESQALTQDKGSSAPQVKCP